MATIRSIAIGLFCLLAVPTALFSTESLDSAWNLLINNKPLEARSHFEALLQHRDSMVVGQAHRGVSLCQKFLGDLGPATHEIVRGYESDRDMLMLYAHSGALFFWSRSSPIENAQTITKTITRISKQACPFRATFLSELLFRNLNDGKLQRAWRLNKELGCIDTWQMIGPFENISNCGFANPYPPEQEIVLDKYYQGKDGNRVRWNPIINRSPLGWLFVENHSPSLNAVNYFYSSVSSPINQKATLSFGASGCFKVFVNRQLVMQDSVYRNTGIDGYLQQITLVAGVNEILVKLTHEESNSAVRPQGHANFCLRLTDASLNALGSIKIDSKATRAEHTMPSAAAMDMQGIEPLYDSIHTVLSERMNNPDLYFDALLALVTLSNLLEKTDIAQKLCEKALAISPASSLLHTLYAEALLRGGKKTEAAMASNKAHTLCSLNFEAWSAQLSQTTQSQNPQQTLSFLNTSPAQFKTTLTALIASVTLYAQLGNEAKALEAFQQLEQLHEKSAAGAQFIAQVYTSRALLPQAVTALERVIKNNHATVDYYRALADLQLKQGAGSKALALISQARRFNPNDADLPFYLARIHFAQKEFDLALSYANEVLRIMPGSANALTLKGNILVAMGRRDEAGAAFRVAIDYTSDDFIAWEALRELEQKPSFETLTPLPNVDSAISAAAVWQPQQQHKPLVVSAINDVYVYPSRCSRSRWFMIVKLPTQEAIDQWKEYRIPFNSSYQTYMITRALSYKVNGSQLDADKNYNQIVFKSLEPGDCIVLEYSLYNYYQGAMANQIYGDYTFYSPYPVSHEMLRMVVPLQDSIPYTVFGEGINQTNQQVGDYRIITFSQERAEALADEQFTPAQHPSWPAVTYSTFENWAQIVEWYEELSRNKQKPTLELRELADSLCGGLRSTEQKMQAVHRFITSTINYSSQPFRQSGWVPQAASDVLSTRMGDCKDMASLGKALLNIADVPSSLVLVNTSIHNGFERGWKGPNFDHCILACKGDTTTYYLDFTSKNDAFGTLGKWIQGAMALPVTPGCTGVIALPLDIPDQRRVERSITMRLDTLGTLYKTATTMRSGIHASKFRQWYRFSSQQEREKSLGQTLRQDWPDVTLHSFSMDSLDVLSDSIMYRYTMEAANAVSFSGTTAVFNLHMADKVESGEFPLERQRKNPVDMQLCSRDIEELTSTTTIDIPPAWRLISLPEDVQLHSPNARYALHFKRTDTSIQIERRVQFNYRGVFDADSFGAEQAFLRGCIQADDCKLLFYTK